MIDEEYPTNGEECAEHKCSNLVLQDCFRCPEHHAKFLSTSFGIVTVEELIRRAQNGLSIEYAVLS